VAGTISALIAVVGTLLGVVVTQVFQRRVTEQNQRFAAEQQLRTQRLAVFSDFAGALAELRRAQHDRWHRRQEDPDGEAAREARMEAYRLRGLALHALYRVKLVSGSTELNDLAQSAYERATAIHEAADPQELSRRGVDSRGAVEAFVSRASTEVQAI
jgi:hypothetical protein